MEEERRFYVYAHLEAGTGRFFYIGKGSGKRSLYPRYENKRWQAVAGRNGFYSIILAHGLFEREAYALEAAIIQAFDPGVLVTLALGGAGSKGVKKTEANRAAISARMKERNPMVRADVRERISETRRGKSIPPEVREKISAALIGRKRGPRPPEVIAKLKAAQAKKNRAVSTNCGLRFDSALAAARALGVAQGSISRNCNGQQRTAGGYVWSYAT